MGGHFKMPFHGGAFPVAHGAPSSGQTDESAHHGLGLMGHLPRLLSGGKDDAVGQTTATMQSTVGAEQEALDSLSNLSGMFNHTANDIIGNLKG